MEIRGGSREVGGWGRGVEVGMEVGGGGRGYGGGEGWGPSLPSRCVKNSNLCNKSLKARI